MLSGYLGMTDAELMPLLTKPGTHFVYLKKKVPALTYSALAADLAEPRASTASSGRATRSAPIPNGTVGASVVGFVGGDGKGQAGLELVLQHASWPASRASETYESAPNGSKIPLGQSSITPAQNGLNYPAHASTPSCSGSPSGGSPQQVKQDQGRLGHSPS